MVRGTYYFGLDEQLMFPEVEFDILLNSGMNIPIVPSLIAIKRHLFF